MTGNAGDDEAAMERAHWWNQGAKCERRRWEPEMLLLDAALYAIMLAETADQARGIAHAALHREQYHGHEVDS